MRRLALLVALLASSATPAQAVAPGWSASARMLVARGPGYTATLLPNGKVLVAGGAATDSPLTLSSTELYDPLTGTWKPGPGMKERAGQTATLLKNGKVLLEQGDPFHYYIGAELYDPVANTFATVPEMTEQRRGHTATLLPNGNVLIAGGGVRSYTIYETATNTWRTPKDSPSVVSGATATLLNTGKVLILGGTVESVPTSAAWVYDPVADSFSAGRSMATARTEHTATLLRDGRVLVVGGVDAAGATLSTAEVYDPATNLFPATGKTLAAHARHSATLLTDGRVLLVDTGAAELYDPAAGTWSAAGALVGVHSPPVSLLLANGSVLVPGSAGPSERWTPATTLGVTAEAGLGSVQVGSAGGVTSVPVTNTGGSPLLVDSVTADGDFAIVADHCTDAVIAPGSKCAIDLRFGPLALGERTGVLRLKANTSQREHAVALRGQGTAPPATPQPTASPPATPVPTVARTPPAAPEPPKPVVEIRFRSRYSPSGVPAAKACKGKVTLELRKGRKIVDRAATRLDRHCRYAVVFSFKRARIGKANTLTVVARFHGNRYLGATKNEFKVRVPS